nr:sex determining protein fem 1 [Hymenolepis microstoma]
MPDSETLIVAREIISFCTEGDVRALRNHIDYLRCRGEDISALVNTATSSGQTALIAACRNGKYEIVQYLIDECEANVELVGTVHFDGEAVEGVTPLWCAAAANYLNIVRFLVKRGANVNATTATNSTALRAACFDGHEEIVRFLVKQGADVETPNRHEHTCLMIACFRGHDSIVKFLLTQGARVNRRSAKGNTALHDCSESGNLRCLILLLKHGAIMREDEFGQTPVLSGANSAYRKIVDYLCEMRTSSGEFAIPIEEQAAAHELLGASFHDRQSRVRDAVASWQYAMNLRQKHFGYTKRLPPIRKGALNHYAWSLIEPIAHNAVTKEIVRMKKSREHRNASLGVIDQNCLQKPTVPHPSAISNDSIWSRKFQLMEQHLTERYERLLKDTLSSEKFQCSNWKTSDFKSMNLKVSYATDAIFGIEPEYLRYSSRHIRRPFEGLPDDVPAHEMSPPVCYDEYIQKYFSVPENQVNRWMADPNDFFNAVETEFRTEEESEGGSPTSGERDEASEMIRRLQRYSYATFGNVREFADGSELKAVQRDNFALQLQPLLIRLRILGPDHPDTIYFLRYRGATYADAVAITQCLAFWHYAVELQRSFLEPLSYVSQSSFLALVELYNLILTNRYSGLRAVNFHPSLLIDSLQLVIDNIERGMEFSYSFWNGRTPWAYTSADKEATNLHRHVTHCLHFIALLSYYFCSPTCQPPPLHRHRLASLRRLNNLSSNVDGEQQLQQSPNPVFSGVFPLLDTASGASADLAFANGPNVNEESQVSFPWSVYIPSETEHAQMRSKMTPELFSQFCFQVNRLIRLDPRVHEGASLMHLAATTSRLTRFELFPLPHADLLRLLAALGADPNAVDANGYRPVGRVLTATHVVSDTQRAGLISTLVLDCGAHFDASVMPLSSSESGGEETGSNDEVDPFADEDNVAISVRSLYSSEVEGELSIQPIVESSRIDEEASKMYKEKNTWPWSSVCRRILSLTTLKPIQHVTLACLAARAIPPSLHTLVPPHLDDFVRMHHAQPTKPIHQRITPLEWASDD